MKSNHLNNSFKTKCHSSRRNFIHNATLGLGSLMLFSCVASEPDPLPNIVLILSDDQGYGDYGFMGHPDIETPNLDRLASQSRVFTRGYVNSPLSGPSLACMVTGLHPHQHKKTSNDPPNSKRSMDANPRAWSPERRQLREKVIANFQQVASIPKELQKKNYLSMQTGKWWMGHYSTGGFTHGMTHGDMDKGGRHGDVGLDIGRKTMQPIYDFIDEADNPFFLWYAPMLPHQPHNPPEQLLKKYEAITASPHIAAYMASCEWFDQTCGELLDYLEKSGKADNTIVIYICDNGYTPQFDKPGFHPKSKRSSYEGGARTPIMVKWPGHVKPEMDTITLVNSIDIAPTILSAVGLNPTDEMQGIDLLNDKALKKRKAVFGARYTHDAVDIEKPVSSLMDTYVIEGDWKLIFPTGRNGSGTTPELYNIIADPGETTNLALTDKKKADHLKQLIKEWWPEAVTE
jgi:arylsulfatase A-like enzyme